MSYKGFIAFLQELLTMTDPGDELSRQLAHMVLWNVIEMAETTGTADEMTLRMMHIAAQDLNELLEFRDEVAGVPGQTKENAERRMRLDYYLYPGC